MNAKRITLSLILPLVLFSCRTAKEQVDHGSAPAEEKRTVGTVRATEDCGFYLDVRVGDVAHSLSPVNLDAQFQVDGMRLKFAYEVSVTKPPAACPNFEPVAIRDVTPLR